MYIISFVKCTGVFSQLSTFTADCVRHSIQMADLETIIIGIGHSYCYKLLI